mmetsp:Transcript_28582/g.66223  ORF Transcript_28582/g.66223 Transcript_28582/m.66223 type:complete len:94 (+) Transcript_28582:136-417(+)|eukprot:CAMPEP_0178440710 /NCGR_PEP_ID=MMETSP0689_2-20121128/36949_1 /TAXON_ID=160604 /ORGANISM="Amphidinium massartii, Strain CS-259" /LENGTH=93 /DNA_ID=CAMNT_0020063553 /DNA_START=48 /DNA_END=329 /DNA_ORIENTATION=-
MAPPSGPMNRCVRFGEVEILCFSPWPWRPAAAEEQDNEMEQGGKAEDLLTLKDALEPGDRRKQLKSIASATLEMPISLANSFAQSRIGLRRGF